MKDWEVNDAIECLEYSERNSWEQARIQSLITAQVNSKKRLLPTDIIKFPWDKDVEPENEPEERNIEISSEDIQRLREKSKHINF